jgi:hypothetical protein
MGNRVGLARTQVLIQNLKRSLTMGGTRFVNLKGVEMNVASAEISADGTGGFGDSTGVTVPANSIITGAGVVCTTAFVLDSATLGVTFGTAAAGVQIVADDPNSLQTSGTSLAVGVGTSTHSHEKTALGGAAALVFVADCGYSASARTIYGAITTSAGNVDSGAVRFWVTYRLVA